MKEPRPCHSPGHCDDEPRLEAFERWGVFYCQACVPQIAFCADCYKPLGRATARGKKPICEACRAA